MIKKKVLSVDSRDKHLHVFGQVVDFSPESNFSGNVPNLVESPDGVNCTAISCVKVGDSKTKKLYDVDTLWQATPHSAMGADPRAPLSTAVKNGLFNRAIGQMEKLWSGYFRADTGSLDGFDNCRSAMTITQSGCTIATNFYANWGNINRARGIVPVGDVVVSEHDYFFKDWVIQDGVTYALIDFHLGYDVLMPREVLNAELAKTGCGAWMPSDNGAGLTETRNLLEWLVDLYQNLILAINRLKMVQPPPASPKPPVVDSYLEVKQTLMPNKIEQWAKAIAQWEGDITGHDAGNLKYTTLTKSWGATQGRPAQDGGHFALFKDDGVPALCNFLTLGCENQLVAFHQARTFEAFTKIYAGNPPQNYIEGIRQIVGCQLDTDVSTFLATS